MIPLQFTFNVFFENITQLELQQLCWALDFADESYVHKLGRAKPFGFGSVQFTIRNAWMRKINRKIGGWDKNPIPKEALIHDFAFEKEILNTITSLKQITNWKNRFSPGSPDKTRRSVVRYPHVNENKQSSENAKASHQWFLGNRNILLNSNEMRPLFAKVLPKIVEEVALEGEKENKWLYMLHKLNKQ